MLDLKNVAFQWPSCLVCTINEQSIQPLKSHFAYLRSIQWKYDLNCEKIAFNHERTKSPEIRFIMSLTVRSINCDMLFGLQTLESLTPPRHLSSERCSVWSFSESMKPSCFTSNYDGNGGDNNDQPCMLNAWASQVILHTSVTSWKGSGSPLFCR